MDAWRTLVGAVLLAAAVVGPGCGGRLDGTRAEGEEGYVVFDMVMPEGLSGEFEFDSITTTDLDVSGEKGSINWASLEATRKGENMRPLFDTILECVPEPVGDPAAPLQLLVASLEKCAAQLNEAKPVRALDLSKEERLNLKSFCLITAKPTLYAANVDERGFKDNPLLAAVEAHAAKEKAPVVAFCAAMEAEIADLPDEDKAVFLADMGLEEPGLNRLIRAGYQLLGLQTYFTAGVKEVRAWTIHAGDTAPQAAGVIHTDFEHGFIRAEVISFDDFIACKGEQGAKEAGKMRLEGKEYVVHDGDVMHFRFNV